MSQRWLLDTHTLLWTLYEPERLSKRVRTLIEEDTNEILLSDVSVLEITSKAVRYRLPQAGSSVDVIMGRILGLKADMVSIHLDDIAAAAKLPPHHFDPLDRVLIAQAVRLGATLLSKDGKFALYDVPVLWT